MLSQKTPLQQDEQKHSSKPCIIVCDPQMNRNVLYFCVHAEYVEFVHEGKTQNLLSYIQHDISKLGCDISDVVALGVIMEGESFTATRVATVIMNTWSFVSGLSVAALPREFIVASSTEKKRMWDSVQHASHILPTYYASINITRKS